MSTPPRTTADEVMAVLLDDYPTTGPPGFRPPDLRPRIRAASIIMDKVVDCAAKRNRSLTVEQAREIETWLAAHFYTKSDPVYQSKSTGGSSGSFVRDPKSPEPYKDGALMLDTSGCLNSILNNLRASGDWLGKPPSSQIPYDQRD